MSNKKITASSQVQSHSRVNNTPIGGVEKKVLLWLSGRMPGWIVPDTLTMIGLLGSVLIFIGYALTSFHPGYLWLASFGFVVNWFGDSLDGTLARYRKIERPRYGFFIDHIIDAISEVLIFIGLGLSPYLHFNVALLALVAYLLASIYVYLATFVNGVFRISYSGLGPTEIRLIAIITNTIIFFTGNPIIPLPSTHLLPSLQTITLFDLVTIGLTIVIICLFLFNTISTAMSLSREDREVKRAKRAARRKAQQDERIQRKLATR
jgi:archaetidylinositol phosphate synthase